MIVTSQNEVHLLLSNVIGGRAAEVLSFYCLTLLFNLLGYMYTKILLNGKYIDIDIEG